jgi:peptidoglycan/xylan/chitin deacetylase (PgdA/CDA1 family)
VSGRFLRWVWSLAHRPPVRGEARLTIVRHHRVYANGERPLYRLGVSEDVFVRQLELFGRLGSPPLTVSEGLERLRAGDGGHWVALTFDDGYADNVSRALPHMLRHGARGTFFLTSGLIESREAPWWDSLAHALETSRRAELEWSDRPDGAARLPLDGRATKVRALQALVPAFRLPPERRAALLETLRERLGVRERAPCELATWDEARSLADAGMEIGAHTMNHPHLTVLDADAQAREIADSRSLIERRLGTSAPGFAYPDGDHDATSVAAARAAGTAWAVTTRGGDNTAGVSVWELRRRGLSEGACLGPRGRFSERLARAELHGAFDVLRRVEAAS